MRTLYQVLQKTETILKKFIGVLQPYYFSTSFYRYKSYR